MLIQNFQLVWLIVTVATGHAPIPIIALALIAAVYGLQVAFTQYLEFALTSADDGSLGNNLHFEARVHARWVAHYISDSVCVSTAQSSRFDPVVASRYPVYSFFLPIYSFWCMDDFSWGNTRVVVGEGANKKVMIDDDEKFDDSMIPMKRFSGALFLRDDGKDLDIHRMLVFRIRGGDMGNRIAFIGRPSNWHIRRT